MVRLAVLDAAVAAWQAARGGTEAVRKGCFGAGIHLQWHACSVGFTHAYLVAGDIQFNTPTKLVGRWGLDCTCVGQKQMGGAWVEAFGWRRYCNNVRADLAGCHQWCGV